MRSIFPALALAALILPLSVARAEMPEAIATPGQTLVATVHAEGAQVYECKTDASGRLAWQFREPIATLLIDGKTVGRHYAGPNWEMADGSAVVAKVAGARSRRDGRGHPAPEARGHLAARARPAQRRHHGAAPQHQGRRRRGGLQPRRCVPQRALLGGLRLLQEGAVPLIGRAACRRRGCRRRSHGRMFSLASRRDRRRARRVLGRGAIRAREASP